MTTPRKRRWVRWTLWSLATLAAGRVLLALSLPWLLGLAAGSLGLSFSYRASALSLLGLSLRFEDLVVRAAKAPEDPPLLSAEDLVVDLSMSRLLRGTIAIVDAAMTGGRLHLQRGADGALCLPEQLRAGAPAAPPTPAAPPAGGLSPVRFDLPIQVASARLHDLQVVFEDAATTPARRVEFAIDVDLADLGHGDHPASFSARVHSPEWFDDLWLRATATTAADHLEVSWRASLRGVHPQTVAGANAQALPWSLARSLDVELNGQVRGRTIDGRPRQPELSAELHGTLLLDETERLRLDLVGGPSLPTDGGLEWPFTLHATGNGLVDELQFQHGVLSLGSTTSTIATDVTCKGLSLELLAPWLASRGVSWPKDGIAARLGLRAELRESNAIALARLEGLALEHGDDRVEWARIEVAGLHSAGGRVAIDAIRVEGPKLAVGLQPDEAVSVVGIQLRPHRPEGGSVEAPTPGSAFTWPAVRIGELAWRGAELKFTDATLAEAATIVASDVSLQGKDLGVGPDASPGRLVAGCRIVGATGDVRAELEFTPAADALAADLRLTADGVTCRSLAPWLQRAGATPVLQDATVRLLASARLAANGQGITATAHLANLRVEDRGELLLALRNLDLRDLHQSAAATDLGTLTIDEPYLVLRRNADGTSTALGLRLSPTPAAERTGPSPSASDSHTAFRHGPLTLRRGVVRCLDEAGGQELVVGADCAVGANDGSTERTPYEATIRIEGAVETLGVRGDYAATPGRLRIEAELAGSGLRGTGLRGLLPPHVACTLQEGELRGHFSADLQRGPLAAMTLTVRNVALTDHGAELCGIDTVEVRLPRISPELVHVASVQVRGVRAVLASTAGGLQLPGLSIGQAPLPAPTDTGPGRPAAAPLPDPIPALRVDDCDLQLDRVVWRERLQVDGEPLVGSLRLRLAEPWATAADLSQTPEARFLLTGSIEPLCKDFAVEALVQPFQLAPLVDLSVLAKGIDTTVLARTHPSLGGRVEGLITAGEFEAHGHVRLGLHRRDPRRFDFSRPFGGDVVLENVALRAAPEAPAMLALESLHVDVRTFDPSTGDLLLREVDVDGPAVRLERTGAGLELLGLRLRPAAESTALPRPADRAETTRQPELAIQRLLVQGLSFDFVDTTTTPPTSLPLRDCDVQVQDFTTRAATEPRAMAFSASLRGGDVMLEHRVVRNSVVSGVLGSAAGALTGGKDQHEREARPLVDEIRVSGQLQVFPVAKGKLHASMRTLELTALRGLAGQGGVDIADGTLDWALDADLLGHDGVRISSRPTFTWLSLSEPPNGPISTYLKLPMPLDTVLFLLRNDADEHMLPMQLCVPSDGLDSGAIAEATVEALVRLIADAVKGAALRTAGTVTGVFGLGARPEQTPLVAALTFAGGDPLPTGGSLDELVAAVASDPRLGVVLTHELGPADLARAAELANPPHEVVAATVARLRAERSALESQRAGLAADVAARFAAGQTQVGQARRIELHALDEQLGGLEETLDEALTMLAGEGRRAVERRTRQGAIELAENRLAAVRSQIVARTGPGAAARIVARRPRAVAAAGLPQGGRVVATTRLVSND